MPEMQFDDDVLMAFADGELDAVTAALVARKVDSDPELQKRVGMFRSTRAAAADAMKPLAASPVPERLREAVDAAIARDVAARAAGAQPASGPAEGGGATVVSFRKRPSPARGPYPGSDWLVPLAASIVMVLGAGGGYLVGYSLRADEPVQLASIGDPAILQALSEVPSGGKVELPKSGDLMEAIISFQLEDGTLCREYKLGGRNTKGVVSIACLEEDRWRTHLLMAASRLDEGYEPAGSVETIDAYLASIHASAPLDGTAEQQALSSIRKGGPVPKK